MSGRPISMMEAAPGSGGLPNLEGDHVLIAVVGILVVAGAVFGGYVMEGGHIPVLFQPAEFVIIGGAALGSIFISTPMGVLKSLFRVLNDFEETVRQKISLDGRTYVNRDGEGYRSALEQLKGQPEPITP